MRKRAHTFGDGAHSFRVDVWDPMDSCGMEAFPASSNMLERVAPLGCVFSMPNTPSDSICGYVWMTFWRLVLERSSQYPMASDVNLGHVSQILVTVTSLRPGSPDT